MSGIKQAKGSNFAATPYKDVPRFFEKLADREILGRDDWRATPF